MLFFFGNLTDQRGFYFPPVMVKTYPSGLAFQDSDIPGLLI